MKVLAVNTASQRLSIALVDGDKILFATEVDEPRDQGNFLLKTASSALSENGLSFAQLDFLAAVTGPGSFTGIRIGLAAMQGFSLAAGVPLAGINCFDLYAATSTAQTRHRLTVLESWRDELYFRLDEAEPFNVAPAACLDYLQARNVAAESVTLAGDAAAKMATLLPAARMDDKIPTATDAALLLTARAGMRGPAVPFYLRPADATPAAGGRHVQKANGG